MFLFDSFKGRPAPNTTYDRYFRKGQMAASADAVRALLSEFQSMTEIRVGWMPTTFKGLGEKNCAFVNVEVNLYNPPLENMDKGEFLLLEPFKGGGHPAYT